MRKIVYALLLVSVSALADQPKSKEKIANEKEFVRVKNCKTVKLNNGEKAMYCEKLKEPKS